MKIRIGVSLSDNDGTPAGFAGAVDRLETAGIDSLWLPERVYGAAVEPFTGIAFALARTRHLKAGSGVSILPGRHPVLVAKQLVSLAGLAPGRVLPVFGLQPALPAERELFPIPRGHRGAVFDEALTLLRRLLTTDAPVSFDGRFFAVTGARVGPPPGKPLDIWLGGSAPAALRRVGRLGDGWLGSFMSPEEAGEAVRVMQAAAAEAGREVDPEHFGMNIAIALGPVPDSYAQAVARRRPGVDAKDLVADGWSRTRQLIEEFAKAGVSKFVVRSVSPDVPLDEFTDAFVEELKPLQT